MSKIIIIPNNMDMIDSINCDGYIVGIKDLSVNLPIYFSLNEVLDIIKKCKNKTIFVSLNKNMHNKDLDFLKMVLIELNNYDVKVLYYDISVVSIKEELNLDIDLVWNQEHMTTNVVTANYWYKHGVSYTYLSSEITKEEINKIVDEYKGKVLINMFGYIPMFTSKRRLVKNYLDYFKIDNNNKHYYMEKEGKKYIVVDDNLGTTSYSNYILNGIIEYINMNVPYIVLNSFMINDDSFKQVVDIYKRVNKDNVLECNDQIEALFDNTSSGFLNVETVYKVKYDEK